jgi:hypothetical protein
MMEESTSSTEDSRGSKIPNLDIDDDRILKMKLEHTNYAQYTFPKL